MGLQQFVSFTPFSFAWLRYARILTWFWHVFGTPNAIVNRPYVSPHPFDNVLRYALGVTDVCAVIFPRRSVFAISVTIVNRR